MKRRLLIIASAAAVTLTGCKNLTPEQNGQILGAGLRIVETRLSK